MEDYLDRLSDFAAGITYEKLSESARTTAAAVVMDTLGAMVAGSRIPENANLARFAAGASNGGSATLLGHSLKAQPMMAALSNATAGVSLEMDEGTRLGGGHPSIHVFPGALAVAEDMGLSGAKLAEGLVAGYEVLSRIGGATAARPNVHSHGTWGTIGTAVAVARLMDFDPPRMRQVINLAASMSPANTWTPCFEGATIRNVYPGRSGMQGILAVQLQQCGYTPLQDAPTDVYTTILGDAFDSEAAVAGLGQERLRIEQNYFKFHACCLYNHPVLDAVESLVNRENFNHGDVNKVNVTTVPFAVRMAQDYPTNMLSAKFHVPYAVAALLVKGRTDITAFYPESVGDSAIRHLAQRVTVTPNPDMSMQMTDRPCATVSVTLKNGSTLSESTTFVRGDFERRRSHRELEDKFRFLNTEILGQAKTEQTIKLVADLGDIHNVGDITALLGGSGNSGASA